MSKHTQKRTGNGILRACFVGISLLLQIGWLLLVILELNHYSTYISLLSGILAALVVLGLYSKNTNSAFKLPWIMLILALPVMGLSLYLMTQLLGTSRYTEKKLKEVGEKARIKRKLECVSPSKYKTVSTMCSKTRGPARAPSLVT